MSKIDYAGIRYVVQMYRIDEASNARISKYLAVRPVNDQVLSYWCTVRLKGKEKVTPFSLSVMAHGKKGVMLHDLDHQTISIVPVAEAEALVKRADPSVGVSVRDWHVGENIV